jgi:hypothetical protein
MEDRTLQTATNRNFIKIQINSIYSFYLDLAFYRQKPTLDNLNLLFTYASKNGKLHMQNSDRFPALEIFEKKFSFGIYKRFLANEEALTM